MPSPAIILRTGTISRFPNNPYYIISSLICTLSLVPQKPHEQNYNKQNRHARAHAYPEFKELCKNKFTLSSIDNYLLGLIT